MSHFLSVFPSSVHFRFPKNQIDVTEKLKRFRADEDGIATVWSIFWLIICFAISGLSVDVSNAWKVHTILQSTADSSALAGAYELQGVGKTNTEIDAAVKDWAIDFAERNMHLDRYGDVLLPDDVQLGYWSGSSFTPMANSTDDTATPANAVRVITRQSGTGTSSGVGTFFLRFVGFDEFTVATSATVKIFSSKCDFDGIFANGTVHLSTDQTFLDDFCLHGELGVDVSEGNFFEEGTIVSMADLNDCGPDSNHCLDELNDGIELALTEHSISGGKPARIGDYLVDMNSYRNGAPLNKYLEDVHAYTVELLTDGYDAGSYPGIVTETHVPVFNEKFDMTLLKPGVINYIDCPSDGFDVNLSAQQSDAEPIMLQNIIVVGNGCDFKFNPTYQFANSIFSTNATGDETFTGVQGVALGLEDGDGGCETGGDVTLITEGSVKFASQLTAYDLQIIAAKNVQLAAKSDALSTHVGTTIHAGGNVKITTEHTFRGCPGRTVSGFDRVFSWALVL